MRGEEILLEAEFNPKVRTYWLLSGAFGLTVSLIGIPLVPFWFLIGNFVTGRYLRHMRCALTERSLYVNKGWLNRVEKTVPLDKITDLGLAHGPIMRLLGIQMLTVETAGQSAQGPLIKLAGVIDVRTFRKAVLERRDHVVAALAQADGWEGGTVQGVDGAANADERSILIDIRDSLRRIEQLMGTRREV